MSIRRSNGDGGDRDSSSKRNTSEIFSQPSEPIKGKKSVHTLSPTSLVPSVETGRTVSIDPVDTSLNMAGNGRPKRRCSSLPDHGTTDTDDNDDLNELTGFDQDSKNITLSQSRRWSLLQQYGVEVPPPPSEPEDLLNESEQFHRDIDEGRKERRSAALVYGERRGFVQVPAPSILPPRPTEPTPTNNWDLEPVALPSKSRREDPIQQVHRPTEPEHPHITNSSKTFSDDGDDDFNCGMVPHSTPINKFHRTLAIEIPDVTPILSISQKSRLILTGASRRRGLLSTSTTKRSSEPTDKAISKTLVDVKKPELYPKSTSVKEVTLIQSLKISQDQEVDSSSLVSTESSLSALSVNASHAASTNLPSEEASTSISSRDTPRASLALPPTNTPGSTTNKSRLLPLNSKGLPTNESVSFTPDMEQSWKDSQNQKNNTLAIQRTESTSSPGSINPSNAASTSLSIEEASTSRSSRNTGKANSTLPPSNSSGSSTNRSSSLPLDLNSLTSAGKNKMITFTRRHTEFVSPTPDNEQSMKNAQNQKNDALSLHMTESTSSHESINASRDGSTYLSSEETSTATSSSDMGTANSELHPTNTTGSSTNRSPSLPLNSNSLTSTRKNKTITYTRLHTEFVSPTPDNEQSMKNSKNHKNDTLALHRSESTSFLGSINASHAASTNLSIKEASTSTASRDMGTANSALHPTNTSISSTNRSPSLPLNSNSLTSTRKNKTIPFTRLHTELVSPTPVNEQSLKNSLNNKNNTLALHMTESISSLGSTNASHVVSTYPSSAEASTSSRDIGTANSALHPTNISGTPISRSRLLFSNNLTRTSTDKDMPLMKLDPESFCPPPDNEQSLENLQTHTNDNSPLHRTESISSLGLINASRIASSSPLKNLSTKQVFISSAPLRRESRSRTESSESLGSINGSHAASSSHLNRLLTQEAFIPSAPLRRESRSRTESASSLGSINGSPAASSSPLNRILPEKAFIPSVSLRRESRSRIESTSSLGKINGTPAVSSSPLNRLLTEEALIPSAPLRRESTSFDGSMNEDLTNSRHSTSLPLQEISIPTSSQDPKMVTSTLRSTKTSGRGPKRRPTPSSKNLTKKDKKRRFTSQIIETICPSPDSLEDETEEPSFHTQRKRIQQTTSVPNSQQKITPGEIYSNYISSKASQQSRSNSTIASSMNIFKRSIIIGTNRTKYSTSGGSGGSSSQSSSTSQGTIFNSQEISPIFEENSSKLELIRPTLKKCYVNLVRIDENKRKSTQETLLEEETSCFDSNDDDDEKRTKSTQEENELEETSYFYANDDDDDEISDESEYEDEHVQSTSTNNVLQRKKNIPKKKNIYDDSLGNDNMVSTFQLKRIFNMFIPNKKFTKEDVHSLKQKFNEEMKDLLDEAAQISDMEHGMFSFRALESVLQNKKLISRKKNVLLGDLASTLTSTQFRNSKEILIPKGGNYDSHPDDFSNFV